jgi:uncharacterized protein (DUF1778 family)
MKLGRPKKLMEQKKTQLVVVRVREEDEKLFLNAAKRNGKRLSEWIRETLISAASRRGKIPSGRVG